MPNLPLGVKIEIEMLADSTNVDIYTGWNSMIHQVFGDQYQERGNQFGEIFYTVDSVKPREDAIPCLEIMDIEGQSYKTLDRIYK